MKKLFTLLLTLLMLISLVGCNSKEDTPVVQEPEKQEVEEPVQEEIAGGYVDVEDGTLTDELKDIFTKALEGLVGATYEPQKLIATQVVAGTNYKFFAKGSKTTNPVTKGTYYITIYKDLEGKIELKDIEVIEEKQDKVSEDVLKTYNYWVVVYDQFDNEISRDAIKYGTTVKDPDGNDVVVNGNKYFHTYVDYSPVQAPNPPAPLCSNTNTLIHFYDVNNTTGNTYQVTTDTYSYNESTSSFNAQAISILQPEEINFDTNLEEDSWYHSDGTNYVECTDPGHHDVEACLAGNTLITMADGTKKKVESLKTGDEIVVFNHDTEKNLHQQ